MVMVVIVNMGMVVMMGLLLVGMGLLLLWLWFAVQEPDCAEVRRRPGREYVGIAPSQPPPNAAALKGEELPSVVHIVSERPLTRSEVERVKVLWRARHDRYRGVVYLDSDGLRGLGIGIIKES